MARYSFTQLEQLWIQAGGNPIAAPMAAAIAMAESGGDANAVGHPSNGTEDRGLWQINSIHGSQSTLDPLANAKAAVAISQNGTTWKPWCTAWSTGRCSGTYLSSDSPFRKFLPGGASTGVSFPSVTDVQNPVGNIAGGITSIVGGPAAQVGTAIADAFLRPIAVWGFYFLMVSFGVILTGFGIFIFVEQSKTGQMVLSAVLSRGRAIVATPQSETVQES